MVNRIAPHGDVGDGEHREGFLFVVVAGVVAIRAFERGFVRIDIAFEHDLGAGRNLQIATHALHDFGFRATQ